MNNKIIPKWLSVAFGISIGALLSQVVAFYVEKATPAICFTGIIFLLILKKAPGQKRWLLLFSLLYGFTTMELAQEHFLNSSWRLPKKTVILLGELVSLPETWNKFWRYQVQIQQFRMEEGRWIKASDRVEVTSPAQESPPLWGDFLILKGVIRFPGLQEPGSSWMRRRLFLQNLQAQVRVKKTGDMILLDWNRFSLPIRIVQLLREGFSKKIDRIVKAEQAALLKALLLGERMPDAKLRQVFNLTGTSHLLSVSGFHTTVVAGIIFSGLIFLRFSPTGAVMGATLMTLSYMLLTGWGVAVQRAGLMTIFVWVAWVLGRPQSLLYWLHMALAIILMGEPKMIWDVSFQLSFLSMYGILLVTPHLNFIRRIPGLDMSVAAFFATYPVVLFYFQSFAWVSVVANLIAVPLFALILPLGLMALIPGGDYFVGLPLKMFLSVAIWILEKISHLSWTAWTLPQPSLSALAAYYLLGGMTLWLGQRRDESSKRFAF